MNEIHIPQGGLLKLEQDEISILSSTFKNIGIDISCIDFNQGIVSFPQAYVGYISLPDRKIIINPKHEGVTFKHILCIYYFLYTSDSSDLDEPIYDVDAGNSYDIIQNFVLKHHLCKSTVVYLKILYFTLMKNLSKTLSFKDGL